MRPARTGPNFIAVESTPEHQLLARTEPARRANGERKLAHNIFMQITWGLLAVAALAQLFLLVWLDVMS